MQFQVLYIFEINFSLFIYKYIYTIKWQKSVDIKYYMCALCMWHKQNGSVK